MKHWHLQAERVRRALADPRPILVDQLLLMRDLDGQLARGLQPPAGSTPREAAALLLLIPAAEDLLLPLTLRSPKLSNHSGEVSLPGGAVDPDDGSPAATALREAHEEIGVPPKLVEVWGNLAPIYIPPSNFRLTPVVGFTPAMPPIVPNPREVAAVLLVSLSHLLDPANVSVEEWERRGMRLQVPFFSVQGHKVWGATAVVLSELVGRLRRV